MTREEKIHDIIVLNISDKAAADISQLFDEEMIEFAEFVENGNYPSDIRTTAELLQLFKDKQ